MHNIPSPLNPNALVNCGQTVHGLLYRLDFAYLFILFINQSEPSDNLVHSSSKKDELSKLTFCTSNTNDVSNWSSLGSSPPPLSFEENT